MYIDSQGNAKEGEWEEGRWKKWIWKVIDIILCSIYQKVHFIIIALIIFYIFFDKLKFLFTNFLFLIKLNFIYKFLIKIKII